MKVLVTQSWQTLQPHGLQPIRLLCPWISPGQNTGVGSHFLLQGIFPTQGLNPGLLHCRQVLYQLTTREATQVSIRRQIYFYVRARMSGITQQALMTQWELGAEMGWMESIKHRKLHQPFHVCLTCFFTPDWGLVFMFVPANWAILP